MRSACVRCLPARPSSGSLSLLTHAESLDYFPRPLRERLEVPRTYSLLNRPQLWATISADCRQPSGSGRSIAVLREPQVYLAGRRIGPAACYHLLAREEVDAVRAVHVRIAEQRRLPPAERIISHRHGYRHVYADHADVHFELEPARCAAVSGEQRNTVAVRVLVHQLDSFVVAPYAHHRQDRSEDLILVHAHAGLHFIDE